MSDYDQFESNRVKHLELIQQVVGRLGNNGFVAKGWALTAAAAFLGFAVTTNNKWLAVASIVPTLLFCALDAYFLRSERLFRALYGRVRSRDTRISPFFMNATSADLIDLLDDDEKKALNWWSTFRRPTLFGFYATLLIAAAAVLIALTLTSSPTSKRDHPDKHAALTRSARSSLTS